MHIFVLRGGWRPTVSDVGILIGTPGEPGKGRCTWSEAVLAYAPWSVRQGAPHEGQPPGAPQFRQTAGRRTPLDPALSAAARAGEQSRTWPSRCRHSGECTGLAHGGAK